LTPNFVALAEGNMENKVNHKLKNLKFYRVILDFMVQEDVLKELEPKFDDEFPSLNTIDPRNFAG
jgi:cyclophilin family peptidyl-prolyl cis-trans isomerase